MKKRKLSLLLAGLLTITALTGCSSSSSTASTSTDSTATPEAAAQEKILRVGMECAYAPFNWTQETDELADGSTALPIYGTDDYAYGYDVMMALMLADEMGYDGVEIHRSEWDSLGLGLEGGDFDCIIAGMSKTAEREKIYAFSDTYYIRKTVITVPSDSEYASFTKLSDFAGYGVTSTTQLGTSWIAMQDQIPDVNVGAAYATTAECFMAVVNGAADLTVIDEPTSQSALLTNPDLVILTLDEDDDFEDTATNICISTTLDNTDLVAELDAALAALEWDKDKMDAMMLEAIALQPANN